MVFYRQLGYDITNSEVRSYTRDAHPDLSISLHYVTCTGAESTLSECSIPHWGVAQEESCMNDKDAWVDCKHIAISSSSSTSTTQGPREYILQQYSLSCNFIGFKLFFKVSS